MELPWRPTQSPRPPSERGLGRRLPPDWRHYERFPLTAATTPAPPTPVAIGVNWYTAFDSPEKVGRDWWVARDGSLGTLRGGHCVCVKPDAISDRLTWWAWLDQGSEGSCVGHGCSRMMMLLNRRRYDARWLWDQAKMVDDWPETNPGDDQGTSVRAACDVLRAVGHVRWRSAYAGRDWRSRALEPSDVTDGIAAYRWARTVDEMRAALSSPSHDARQAFPILNSWGRSYPHVVWVPYEVMARLLGEDGEAVVVTDR